MCVALYQSNVSGRQTRLAQVEALGSHTLAQLLDLFACPSSNGPGCLLPDCRNQSAFIEGRFYDDTRPANALRYSDELRAWLRANPRVVPAGADLHAPSDDAEQRDLAVPLASLSVRCHAGYLWLHQGDCAHVFAVNAVRLRDAHDPPPAAFPRIVHNPPKPLRICRVRAAHTPPLTTACRFAKSFPPRI